MALAKTYDIGDTVYVAYPVGSANYFTPQEQIVKSVDFDAVGNVSKVEFEDGVPVIDSDAEPTIYATQALAAAAIVDDVIAKVAPTVVLDATVSIISAAGNASVTLGRIG